MPQPRRGTVTPRSYFMVMVLQRRKPQQHDAAPWLRGTALPTSPPSPRGSKHDGSPAKRHQVAINLRQSMRALHNDVPRTLSLAAAAVAGVQELDVTSSSWPPRGAASHFWTCAPFRDNSRLHSGIDTSLNRRPALNI